MAERESGIPNGDGATKQVVVKHVIEEKSMYDPEVKALFDVSPLVINLGYGMENAVNIDSSSKANIMHENPAHLPFVKSGIVDTLMARHILPRIYQFMLAQALAEWNRILKVGGELHVECPDMELVCKEFLKKNDIERYQGIFPVIWPINGPQVEMYFDQSIFVSNYTRGYLRFALENSGFKVIGELSKCSKKLYGFGFIAEKLP